jgi:UDP:flavonoid glycosyltransferase YjiC (YdhE family)
VPLAADAKEFLDRGEAPLIFTPGSANAHGKQFFQAAVDACQSLGRRGILLTEFPEQLPSRLPETVAHFRYVPLDLLLPRAAAFIHHGGIGSTSQAIVASLPQIVMPLAHDQFDNADRVVRLGVGSQLAVNRFSGARLAQHLDALLSSSTVAAACRDLAVRLRKRDGLQRAADAIEVRAGLAIGEPQPV